MDNSFNIVLSGGAASRDGEYTRQTYLFNVKSGLWSRTADRNRKRAGHACLFHPRTNRVYVAGGRSASIEFYSSFWTQTNAQTPTSGTRFLMAAVRDFVYIIDVRRGKVTVLDTSTLRLTAGRDMPVRTNSNNTACLVGVGRVMLVLMGESREMVAGQQQERTKGWQGWMMGLAIGAAVLLVLLVVVGGCVVAGREKGKQVEKEVVVMSKERAKKDQDEQGDQDRGHQAKEEDEDDKLIAQMIAEHTKRMEQQMEEEQKKTAQTIKESDFEFKNKLQESIAAEEAESLNIVGEMQAELAAGQSMMKVRTDMDTIQDARDVEDSI